MPSLKEVTKRTITLKSLVESYYEKLSFIVKNLNNPWNNIVLDFQIFLPYRHQIYLTKYPLLNQKIKTWFLYHGLLVASFYLGIWFSCKMSTSHYEISKILMEFHSFKREGKIVILLAKTSISRLHIMFGQEVKMKTWLISNR